MELDIEDNHLFNMISETEGKENYLDNDIYYKICDANVLIDAYNKSKKNVDWKCSVQRYKVNLLVNTLNTLKELSSDEYLQQGFYDFQINERGKIREIRSMCIKDRVVQRAVCDYILLPLLNKYLTYDNGASMKHKGIHFARNRLKAHLQKFYRETGSNEGYVLCIDFSKFFDNIDHKKLKKLIKEKMCYNGENIKAFNFVSYLIDTFSIDVSFMDDEEYDAIKYGVFNTASYYDDIRKIRNTGVLTREKLLDKSLGIGSQISQISGIYFPTRLDNYIKIVKGIKYYGRYMDDTYIIHQSKEYLQELYQDIKEICDELGIYINMKKTQIYKIEKGFTFLKIRYFMTKTGKVVMNVSKDSLNRERRKLKKMKFLLDNHFMTYEDINNSYQSWKGGIKKYECKKQLARMDALYNKLFIEPFIYEYDYWDYYKKPNKKVGKNELIKVIAELKELDEISLPDDDLDFYVPNNYGETNNLCYC